MRNLLSAAFAAFMLAGCATTTEYARQAVEYGKHAGTWIGQKIESLYASEGKPSAVEVQPDGGKVVEYQRQQTAETAPGVKSTPPVTADASAATGAATTPATRTIPCTTRYKVDNTGTIRSWTIDGEGCKAVVVEKTQTR